VVAGGKLRVLKAHSPAKELENHESGRKKLEFGLGRQENGQIPTRSTQGRRMLLQLGGIPSLERFQVDPYGKSPLKEYGAKE